MRYIRLHQTLIAVLQIATFRETLSRIKNMSEYDFEVPIFPLNTDGIDVSGTNVIIRNCSIEVRICILILSVPHYRDISTLCIVPWTWTEL